MDVAISVTRDDLVETTLIWDFGDSLYTFQRADEGQAEAKRRPARVQKGLGQHSQSGQL